MKQVLVLEGSMKRVVVFFILVFGLCLNLFSLELSLGGGVAILPYQEGLRLTAPGYQAGQIRNHWADWGIYAFFDAWYVEINAAYYMAFSGDYEQYNNGAPLDFKVEYDDIKISYLDLGILLKYPLKAGTRTAFVLTPMLGFNYWINLNAAYGYKNIADSVLDIRKKEWDQMFIKLGLGFDKYFNEKVYLRFTAKLAFPIIAEEWRNRGENIEDFFGIVISNFEADGTGAGGEFTLALGLKIN
jgi:hypothetical protein